MQHILKFDLPSVDNASFTNMSVRKYADNQICLLSNHLEGPKEEEAAKIVTNYQIYWIFS